MQAWFGSDWFRDAAVLSALCPVFLSAAGSEKFRNLEQWLIGQPNLMGSVQ